MAQREVPEINAGSMADIAFLLLIFFLVTTTMDTDEGILRILPPYETEPDPNPPEVIQRNVYEVLVNFNDELLVEDKLMDIKNLKRGARNFYISNGTFEDLPQNEDLPIKKWVRKAELEKDLELAEAALKTTDIRSIQSEIAGTIKKLKEKLETVALIGEYKELPGVALINLQNDGGTSYKRYIQVQNQLTSAINGLRDELSSKKFGMPYPDLVEMVTLEPEKEAEWKAKVKAIRAVYPQRISEAEPRKGQ